MQTLMTLAIIAAIAAVVFGLGRIVLAIIASGGAQRERATRAEADLSVAKAQAEIMAERREAEDVARDLDRREF